jgi:hypothetical protein
VNVYSYDGNRSPTHHTGPDFGPEVFPNTYCWPHGCGGISRPFKNPNPEDRTPENLPSCIYGRDSVLIYERENKVCPYKFIDGSQARVERRRQEWFLNNKKIKLDKADKTFYIYNSKHDGDSPG